MTSQVALQLAVTAPTEEKKELAVELATQLIAGMTLEEVEACKALAEAGLSLGQ